MQLPGNATGILGFESFASSYEEVFAPWFETFAEDLQVQSIGQSQRLDRLQGALESLVRSLDEERLYERSRWMRFTS